MQIAKLSRTVRFVLCGAAVLLLAACGDGAQAPASSAREHGSQGIVLNRGISAEPKSLDPANVDGLWEIEIAGDLLMGLTTEDAGGNPIPGAAQTWDSSPDGLTWTFHLRDHAWSDGVPVAADDFVFAWRRILDPRTAASYAYYLYPIKNARDVNTGKLPGTELGVLARDAKTLVVTLERPLPFAAEFFTHSSLFPSPRHAFEAKGAAWTKPGNYLSNGAYVLEEWLPNDHITLARNARFYDAGNVKIDRVNYYPMPDGDAALKRFRAGELDVQDPVPPSQIDWLRANLPDTLQIVPALEVVYLSINIHRKPLDDIGVREALNLALDRESLVDKLIRLGERPAYAMVPPGTANYPGGAAMRFKDMAFGQRLLKAQSLMRAAGYGPLKALHLRFATTTNVVTRRTNAPIQEMLRKIYVDLEIVQTDSQINLQKLRDHDFDLAVAGWSADYNDATNFLDVLRSGGGKNYGGYSNRNYDALLDKAASEGDVARRGQMLAEAEQMMLGEYPLIFVRFATTHAIVRPYVKGWIANSKQINHTRWLSVERQ